MMRTNPSETVKFGKLLSLHFKYTYAAWRQKNNTETKNILFYVFFLTLDKPTTAGHVTDQVK
jgi:hypothetical protein